MSPLVAEAGLERTGVCGKASGKLEAGLVGVLLSSAARVARFQLGCGAGGCCLRQLGVMLGMLPVIGIFGGLRCVEGWGRGGGYSWGSSWLNPFPQHRSLRPSLASPSSCAPAVEHLSILAQPLHAAEPGPSVRTPEQHLLFPS